MSRLPCWLISAAAVGAAAAPAQPPSSPAPAPDLVLAVGTVHPVSGPSFADGVIVLGGGRILAVGPRGSVPLPDGVPVVALPNGHAYPGLVDACTDVGVPAGGFGEGSAGLEVAPGVDLDAHSCRAMPAGGITTWHVLPAASGRWRGIGALVRAGADGGELFGESARGAVFLRLVGPAGQHPIVRQKELTDLGRPFEEAESYAKAVRRHGEAVAKYEKDFQAWLEAVRKGGNGKARTGGGEGDAAAAQEGGQAAAPAGPKRPTYPKAPPPDPAKTALVQVASGELPLWIEAQRRDEIEAALALVAERRIVNACLVGAQRADTVLDEIARSGVAVVLTPSLVPVELDGEPVADTLAAELQRRGVPFAIASGDGRRARALPLLAAACVAHGLPEEAAVRAITLTPAQLLGIAAETGSLEAGKRADVVVTSAPLLRSDARVLRVLRDGRTIYQGR
ncbi:MAG TPA: amidohydrolase family protein [Planctomycetota bacterium]|nr:amidohydrolase family protein [Planctomycetota bacterium]